MQHEVIVTDELKKPDYRANPVNRCFHCKTNFNPIDLTMAVRECEFVDAANYLISLLPPDPGGVARA